MVGLTAQWHSIRARVHEALDSAANGGSWILGDHVTAFENSLAKFSHLKHAIGCASGLDALELGLRALGIKHGDRVLTTPLTAFASTLAIVKTGGVPIYIDVDNSGQIDLDLASKTLLHDPTIKFFLPVHLYGNCVNLSALSEIKNEFNLLVVEDCAQSIGASYDGIYAGTVGQISGTSFYPTKNLGALGDGGAVMTSDTNLASICRSMRDYGQSSKYKHDLVGLNSRLDELQAAILNMVMMPSLADNIRVRKNIANRYLEEIKNPLLSFIEVSPFANSTWHLFPLIVKSNREKFQKYLSGLLIGSSIHYPYLCNEQKAATHFTHHVSKYGSRNAKRIADSVISIPLHPEMDEESIARVIDACNRWK